MTHKHMIGTTDMMHKLIFDFIQLFSGVFKCLLASGLIIHLEQNFDDNRKPLPIYSFVVNLRRIILMYGFIQMMFIHVHAY